MHTILWFEIPCTDIDRAARFYEAMTGRPLKREVFFGRPHAIFGRGGDDQVTGTLIANDVRPSRDGTVPYLNAFGEMDAWLERAAKGGGKVLLPRTSLGPIGFMAQIEDSEGNRVGLFQRLG